MSRAQLTAGVVPRAIPTCRSRATLLCAFAFTGAAPCALAELGTTPSIVIANSIVGSSIRAIKESQRRPLTVPWSARAGHALIRGTASCGSRCREVVVVMILAPSRDVRCGHVAQALYQPPTAKSLLKTQSVIGCSRKFLNSIEGAQCVY